jgi:hypothetical protein
MSADLPPAVRDAVLAKLAELRALLGDDDPELVAPGRAARMTGLTQKRLSQMADEGMLTPRRTAGGMRRYLRSELDALNAAWEANDD